MEHLAVLLGCGLIGATPPMVSFLIFDWWWRNRTPAPQAPALAHLLVKYGDDDADYSEC